LIFQKSLGTSSQMTFNELLQKFNIDSVTYKLSLLHQLRKSQILLKGKFWDIPTNAFNKTTTNIRYINTDIQFILISFVVATYCTSYIIKVNKIITKN